MPNRLGKNADVYLGSAELAAISARLGRIPSVAEYQGQMEAVSADHTQVYAYMNFDRLAAFAPG